ncbi:MAG: hypothetical protein U0414_40625 [Polyangiaceae bacterium]
MRHCPQCGAPHADTAERCATCGLVLALVRGHAGAGLAPRAPQGAQRTILGTQSAPPNAGQRASAADSLTDTVTMHPSELPIPHATEITQRGHGFGAHEPPGARPVAPVRPQGTMMGIAPPRTGLHGTVIQPPQPSGYAQPGAPTPGYSTQPGYAPHAPAASQPPHNPFGSGPPPSRPQSTLLGVARPGIAPLNPGVQKEDDADAVDASQDYQPPDELGATYYNQKKAAAPRPIVPGDPLDPILGPHKKKFDRKMRLDLPVLIPPKDVRDQLRKKRKAEEVASTGSKKGLLIILVALLLAGGAVAFAFLWRSNPLTVQVRAGEGTKEVLDVQCPSCPNGTVLSLDGKTATVDDHRATLELPSTLAIGDTTLKVAIDRPGSGRDETIPVKARVSYRVRPDLTMLEADKPAIQIVVEAMPGSKVMLDGSEIQLRDGRAIQTLDITSDLEGDSLNPGNLDRKVSFSVTPPDGSEEKGVVAVSAVILPLSIESPSPLIITDKSSFVLAGKTLPGAKIAAANNEIDVNSEGIFSREMNVLMVGSTTMEVRAKMPGKAPRLVRIKVERVASLEAAAADFKNRSPLDYAGYAANPDANKGKPVMFEGTVASSKIGAFSTTMVVHAKCDDGKLCPVRLATGAIEHVKPDDKIRVFGFGTGSWVDPAAKPGEDAKVPAVDVAFILVEPAAKPPGKKP